MRTAIASVLGAFALLGVGTSDAAVVYKASFENLTGSQTIGSPSVNAGDLIAWSGLIENQSGAVTNSVSFTAGASTIDLSAAWFVKSASRLVGVNIDLLDATNTVVASDTFQGVTAGVAVSSLSFGGLVAGNAYTLKLTGNSITNGNYDVKVDVTPIPASLALLASAVAGLGLVRFRRQP